MATLIKLPSGLVVNLDNVTRIERVGDWLDIVFGAMYLDGDRSTDFTRVADKDAAALRAWLDISAVDLARQVENKPVKTYAGKEGW